MCESLCLFLFSINNGNWIVVIVIVIHILRVMFTQNNGKPFSMFHAWELQMVPQLHHCRSKPIFASYNHRPFTKMFIRILIVKYNDHHTTYTHTRTPKSISIFTICVTSLTLSVFYHRKSIWEKCFSYETYTYSFIHSLTHWFIYLTFCLSLCFLFAYLASVVVSTWFDYQLLFEFGISWNGFAFRGFFRNFRSMAFCPHCFR